MSRKKSIRRLPSGAHQVKRENCDSYFPALGSPLRKSGFTVKRVMFQVSNHDMDATMETLKSAWKNLPCDFTSEERFIFLEIAEKLVRTYTVLRQYVDEEETRTKN